MGRGGKLKWKKWVAHKVRDYAQRGAMHAMLMVYSKSQEHVPLDDGELSTGARVSSEGSLTDHLEAVVAYGTDPISAQYAVKQHEDLSLNHAPGQTAKFLENAFNEQVDEIPRTIADYIRNVL